jgi:pyruvate formate lyase activating enzyme
VKEEMEIVISNIQRFCVNDGSGIRTTVFLKGCSLHCPWCANPETISKKIEKGYGYKASLIDLKREILKDKIYYQNGGGVTFSGGEPLLSIKKYELLLKDLKREGIDICFETSLFIPKESLKIAIDYADKFIVDIKILKKEECKKIIGGNIDSYYENVDLLFKNNVSVIFRIPLVNNLTYDEKNVDLILELLRKYKPAKMELFQVHDLAKSKYEKIGKKFISFDNIDNADIDDLKNKIEGLGINVEIISI